MSDLAHAPSDHGGPLPRLAEVQLPQRRVRHLAESVRRPRPPRRGGAGRGDRVPDRGVYVAEPDLSSGPQYVLAPFLGALPRVRLWQMLGLYSIAAFSSPTRQLPRLLLGWIAAFGLIAATIFFLKIGPDFSRVWLALVVRGRLRRDRGAAGRDRIDHAAGAVAEGRFARRAVVYGSNAHADDLLRALAADAAADVRICGVFDDREDGRAADIDRRLSQARRHAPISSTFCRDNRVDMVLIALPLAAEARVAELKRHIDVLPADIRIAASASELKLSKNAYSYIGNVPMIDLVGQADLGMGRRRQSGVRPCDRDASPWSRWRPSWRWSRSPCGSKAAARCCSARSATASTTS